MNIEYKDRAWLIMQCLKDFGNQPRDQLTSGGSNDEARAAIYGLVRAGLVKNLPENVIMLTLAGSRKLRAINMQASSLQVAGKRLIGTGTTTDAYDGKELRRTCLRPGAYDAFEQPSLMAGKRHYRREIRA
jgi:hypothetical protein